MAINFPTSIDGFTNPTPTSKRNSPSLAGQQSDQNDAIEALEAKVGVDGSAVTTSHDYKLGEVTGSDRAVSKTATQTLTNKTLTTPTIGDFTNAGHNHENAAGGGTLSEAALTLTDVTTNNATTSKHGFLPKPPNNTTQFFRADATWATPPGATVSIFTATGTTLSINPNGAQVVIVWAKGAMGLNAQTVNLQYNGVTKDSVTSVAAGNNIAVPYCLIYTETPAAGANDITITGGVYGSNHVIFAMLIG
jgi:hypothetical protein